MTTDSMLTTVTPLYPPLFTLCSVWTPFQPSISMILTTHLNLFYAQSNVRLTSVVKNLALAGSYLMATVSVLNTVCSMLRTSLRATAIHRKRGLMLAKKWELFLASTYHINDIIYIRLSISLRKNIFHFQTIIMAWDKSIRYIILFNKLDY